MAFSFIRYVTRWLGCVSLAAEGNAITRATRQSFLLPSREDDALEFIEFFSAREKKYRSCEERYFSREMHTGDVK